MHRLATTLPMLFLTGALQAQVWPAERSTHVMTWHGGLEQVVLLGGVDAAQDSALWGWDGQRWNVLAQGGPAGRAHFAMAYDAARDRLVVHGGVRAVFGANRPERNGETWEWNRRTWRRIDAEGGPGVRDHHAMVYDPVRKHIVLFGGADSAGKMLNDTWAWDGRNWRKLADTGAPGRSTHRLSFDSGRNVVLMFGGWGDNGLLNDTWQWDGARWSKIEALDPSGGPAVRFATRTAFDAARNKLVLFGGRGEGANFGDTWEFDGQSWKRVNAAGPALRNVHELVYDAKRRTVLLFGGFNAPTRFSDLWSYDGRSWRQIPRPDAAAPAGGYAPPGPYAVGYRLIPQRDASRAQRPARNFEGRPANDAGTPVQISVWYPARPGGTPLPLGEYHALFTKRASLAPVTNDDVRATVTSLKSSLQFQLGVDLPQATVDSLVMSNTRALRDAAPADGRFPLIVGGLEGPSAGGGLAEYLASHGYVVATSPSLPVTATQQATQPQIALETQTRNIELVQSIVRTLPFVDTARLGLVGLNFDGMAALLHQMRNASAMAVVSLDGWEAKSSFATLRASPYFDPVRVRVPYLLFSQDNAPPGLAFNEAVLNDFKYAQRYAYVLKDMEHAQLITNQTVYPQLSAERRLAYDFYWRTIRAFLDANIKGDAAGRAFLEKSAVQNGYPAWLARVERKLPALTAVPTADEVEEIAMSGNIARLAEIYRNAVRENPALVLFTQRSLNLYAFRFWQRNERNVALQLYELNAEAYPNSVNAHNNLGNAYRDLGQSARALQSWRRALELVDSDPDIAPNEKAAARSNIEQKLRTSGA